MEEFPCSSSRQHPMDSSNYGIYQYSNMGHLSGNQSYTKMHNIIRWKSGKRVDHRLLGLLESFAEIYENRHEFFKKIFHENHDELFKKIGDGMKKKKEMKKAWSMSWSQSVRGINRRGVDGEIDGLRLERFKVKTPNVIVVEPAGAGPIGQGDHGQTTQGSIDVK
ncbi:hypothetical protein CDL12_23583 [Handroanthus impetiginosus]|uniref:Uncharacterized protein n=1 Tax=Handroanthus impetiginosus TaxID=429701 RepID=A0A2G9GF23_9LAMI|nr:hypothetical protein CDL12_23583 [Handroanthus impetiginosus]